MAYNQASAFFLIALIFFAAANPLAHGQLPPLLPFPPITLPPPVPNRNVTISGVLCCTPTGNCQPGSQPAPGAVVDVNCTRLGGQIVRIGQGITTANGSISIIVNLTDLLDPRNILGCTVRVRLPLNETICSVLSNVDGLLVGLLGPITTFLGQLVSALLGLVILDI